MTIMLRAITFHEVPKKVRSTCMGVEWVTLQVRSENSGGLLSTSDRESQFATMTDCRPRRKTQRGFSLAASEV
jgi:hypothetical protein